MEPTASNPAPSDSQRLEAESEWTHLSISTHAQSTYPTTRLTHSNQSLQSQENLIASSSDSLVKITDLQLLTQPHQSLGESDSSTSFDPQAWKRGDTGTTRRPKRTNHPSILNTDHHQQSSQDPKIQSSLSSSYYLDAAFISPTKSSLVDPPPIQRRRATSATRRVSRPIIYQSSPTSIPNQKRSNSANRSSSDLGPSRKKQISSNQSTPPTWKAYTGRDGSSSSARLLESESKQDFIESLANLRAMARIGKLDYISSNSGSSNVNNNNYENDEGDPDESRPHHADLPTSTFNSAVDEQEAEQSNLINNPPDDHHSDPDSNYNSNLSRFVRWSGYIGKAISLKTWQLVGLGGLVFGIGIWAGSLIGRNFSHQKHSKVFKFFW